MILRYNITLVISILCSYFAFSQIEIDYKHKTYVKSLEKIGITNLSDIEEIIQSDSGIKTNQINGKYFSINKKNVGLYQYIYVGRVNSCRAGGCSIYNDRSKEVNSEYFDYFILFDSNFKVKNVKVFNYQATHGQEITSKGWLKQFIDYNGSEQLVIGKNIDAISGATISVYAITADIEMKTNLLKNIIRY